MRRNQNGFSAAAIVLAILIVGIGVFAFYRVRQADEQISKSSINSFEECVAAGNPVMESFPEQCAVDGQTFTNTAQDNEEPVNNGFNTTATSGLGAFEVTFPDGFGEIIKPLDSDAFYLMGIEQPDLDIGEPTKIKEMEGFGTDAPSLFNIIVFDNFSEPIGERTDYTLVNGKENPITGSKYVFVYDEDQPETDGIGYRRLKNDRDYTYVFPLADGKELRVYYHVFAVDPRNNVDTIETIINTIRLKG